MILQVNNEWRIVSDASQWTVQRLHTPQSAKANKAVGEPFWKSEAYCTTASYAAWWLAERRIRDLPGTYPAADALEMLGDALGAIVDDMDFLESTGSG